MQRGMRKVPGRKVLVVEDEAITALMIAHIVEAVGCVVVGPVGSLHEARALAAGELDGAVLDVNLNGEAVFPVADLLAARQVPFVFVTAYSTQAFPAAHAQRRVIGKPFSPTELARAVRQF